MIFRYLPIEKDAQMWGLYVMAAGHGTVPPGVVYPSLYHPNDYLFSWESGRRLSEYQLIYISEGSGEFESRGTGHVNVHAGQLFLIYPGVWHRFRPSAQEGWTENWIGFNGEIADRIMRSFFSPDKAVIEIGHDQEILDIIRSIAGLIMHATPGYQQLIAARTMETIALVRCHTLKHPSVNRVAANKVQQARQYLLNHRRDNIDMKKLAADLGLSYSRFRSMFKEHTGMAPHHYLICIRLNMSCYLLSDSDLPVARVAEIAGFSSQFYFSRMFKQWKNCTPTQYRGQRGEPPAALIQDGPA
jgi:AraC-like DNA-binding protein